jgi:hypothetical protein
VLGASKAEKKMWKGIDKIDTMIYNQSGVHIFRYTNGVMNKCYRCVPKKAKKFIKKSANDLKTIDSPANNLNDTKPTAESINNAILSVIIIIGIMILVLILIANLFGVTLFAITSPISLGYFIKKTYDYTTKLMNDSIIPLVKESVTALSPSVTPSHDNTKQNADTRNYGPNFGIRDPTEKDYKKIE